MSATGNPDSSENKTRPATAESSGGGFPWKLVLVLLVLLASGLGAYTVMKSQTPEQGSAAVSRVPTVKVTVGNLESRIRVAGQTSSRSYADITAPIMRGARGNMVLLSLVESGSRVKAGDLLAEIDTKSLEEQLDDMDDSVEQAENSAFKRKAQRELDLENINQSVRNAKATLDKAVLDAKVAEVRTDVERQLLELSVEEAKANYEVTRQNIDLQLQSQAADLRQLEISYQQQVADRERSRQDLQKFKLKSPIDGLAVVQQVNRGGGDWAMIRQGDQVRPRMALVKVVDPENMQLEGFVNQAESSMFRIGQPATVSLDAFPGITFKGKVYSIGALAVSGGGRESSFVRTVPVKISIVGSDPKLIPDLSGAADVVIHADSNVKIVPRQAVSFEKDQAYVYVKRADRFEKKAVTLGSETPTQIGIKEGVEVGDELALRRP